MKATMLDLRHKTKEILKALQNNEEVRLFYRGKETGLILPLRSGKKIRTKDHPFFGSAKNAKESVQSVMKKLRSPRYAV